MPGTEHTGFDGVLARLGSISLGEMDSVKLLNRIDTKYLTDEATLLPVLEDAAASGYRALEVEGHKINRYDSVYYDTPELRMFLDHHNRHLTRQKVRTRCYVESGQSFLEIKRKKNDGRTKKKRIEIPATERMDFSADAAACDYLAAKSWFTSDQITPSASTRFRRITLVNPSMTERVTIDTEVAFNNFRTGHEGSLRNAVIIEVKQDGRAESTMKKILLEHRVKPFRISKYCMAITLTDSEVKSNRFKEKVRRIEKTIDNKITSI